MGKIRRKFSNLAGEGVSLWAGYEVSESPGHALWVCFLLSADLLFLLPCLCLVIMDSKTKAKNKLFLSYIDNGVLLQQKKCNCNTITVERHN